MLQRANLTLGRLFNHPHARIILILSVIIVATLIGGAPNDMGGG